LAEIDVIVNKNNFLLAVKDPARLRAGKSASVPAQIQSSLQKPGVVVAENE